jgi:hypothetical protein
MSGRLHFQPVYSPFPAPLYHFHKNVYPRIIAILPLILILYNQPRQHLLLVRGSNSYFLVVLKWNNYKPLIFRIFYNDEYKSRQFEV